MESVAAEAWIDSMAWEERAVAKRAQLLAQEEKYASLLLEHAGLQRQMISSDGDCFFHCVAKYLCENHMGGVPPKTFE